MESLAFQFTLPNGETTPAYPLTPAQQLMLGLAVSYGNNVPVLNIVTGYYWQGHIDTKLLKEACEEAMQRCDVMRLRLAPHPLLKVVQFLADEQVIEVGEEDLSHMKWDDAHEFIKERSHALIDMFYKPLHEVKIIHLENDYHGIYLKLHHLGFDGYSSKLLISDIMAIYLHKMYGTEYPKPMKSYFDMLDKEFAYPESKQHDLDVAYWASTITDMPEAIYTDYVKPSRLLKQRAESNNPDLRIASVHDGNDPSSKTLKYSLDEEKSNALKKMCEERGLSVPCVLMLGLRSALSAFNENEKDISFKYMVNRRGSVLEKKSGGMRMHFFSFRTIIEPEMTFTQAAKELEKEQNKLFTHSSLGAMETVGVRHQVMKVKAGPHDTYESMSFSYQPYMPVPSIDEEMRRSSRGFWYNNDASIQNLYLTVMHRSYDAGFDFNFEYRTNNNPIDQLHYFYQKIYKTLMLGIEDPDITIGEILEKIEPDTEVLS